MTFLDDFDAAEVEPMLDFSPIPSGQFAATIIASEEKPTRRGDGKLLQLTFEIMSGSHKRRTLRNWLHLVNPSTAAVEFSKKELSAICRAVGVMKPTEWSQLHHRPLTISVTQSIREDTGETINSIAGYSRIEGEETENG